ncbi:MAG: hypothetical protein AABX70_07780 [Nanoarchaeota archaeon]
MKEIVNIIKSATSIELHVKDFNPIRQFYKSIGFQIILDNPGNYLVVRKENAILNFWGDAGRYYVGDVGRYATKAYFRQWPEMKKGYDVEIIIPVKNIKKYWNNIKNKVKVIDELSDRRWGVKDFRIEDPNGFYIRFTEPFDWLFEFKGYLKE